MNSSIVRVEWPIVITNNGIPFTSGLIPPSEYLLCLMNKVGIPVKVNAVSGGKPNGIPERR
jgi:hypothetical protein